MYSPPWSQSWVVVIANKGTDYMGQPQGFVWKSFRGRVVYGDKLTGAMGTGIWVQSNAECYIPIQNIQPWIDEQEALGTFNIENFLEVEASIGEGSDVNNKPYSESELNDVVIYQQKRSLTNLKMGYIYMADR